MFSAVHHIAMICSDYEVSKDFYVRVLGFDIISENFREDRKSYKLDLRMANGIQLELFSFPHPPKRVSRPEACGLRHLAFAVSRLEDAISHLSRHGIHCESIRTDEFTGRRFTFFADPDGLPLELYEAAPF
jgi:glyoxylase I family protein